MSLSYCITAAALMSLSCSAAAQTPQKSPAPDRPAAMAAPYESAFRHYRPLRDESASPDKLWRENNDIVGALAAKPRLQDTDAAAPGEKQATQPAVTEAVHAH